MLKFRIFIHYKWFCNFTLGFNGERFRIYMLFLYNKDFGFVKCVIGTVNRSFFVVTMAASMSINMHSSTGVLSAKTMRSQKRVTSASPELFGRKLGTFSRVCGLSDSSSSACSFGARPLKWALNDTYLSRFGVPCHRVKSSNYFSPGEKFHLEDVIEAQQFDRDTLSAIFEVAKQMEKVEKNSPGSQILKGYLMATLFYEPSTRTRLSFESAMKRLGGEVLTTENAREFSSAAKGETLEGTFLRNFVHSIFVEFTSYV